jgi:hypothetical protein
LGLASENLKAALWQGGSADRLFYRLAGDGLAGLVAMGDWSRAVRPEALLDRRDRIA